MKLQIIKNKPEKKSQTFQEVKILGCFCYGKFEFLKIPYADKCNAICLTDGGRYLFTRDDPVKIWKPILTLEEI